jgi:DNA-directed RNA polymerase specialized sigma subunit
MATVTINEVIQKTASEVVRELKRKGMAKNSCQTPFQKTEQLLYNYNNFKDAVLLKEEQLEDIRQYGLPERSKSIIFRSGNESINTDSELECAEKRISSIMESIRATKKFINIIDNALLKIRDNEYCDLIELKYFEGRTHEEIADIYQRDHSTITRNKNKLINKLAGLLFSDEVLREIFEGD